MSSSVAPLFPETDVFIPAYWATARSDTLTQDEADTRYLRFPVGQGTESIPNLVVSGSSTLGSVSASNIVATSFTGNVSSTATSANATHYLLFVDTNATGTKLIQNNSQLKYNPNTGILQTATPTAGTNDTSVATTAFVNTTSGWKYTATNTITASTTTSFANCFSAGNFNAYEIYFSFNLTSPTTGYISASVAFQGFVGPLYNTWTQNTSTAPAITTTYTSVGTSIAIINSMDATGTTLFRSAQPKLSVWSCITPSLSSVPQVQFSGENYAINNATTTGLSKVYGFCQATSGSLSGFTLISSSAMTGSITIVVVSKG
jgi:hypothetical protein